jgi:acetate kinase
VTEATTDDVVLCVNSGSSSLKFAVFEIGARGERPLTTGSAPATPLDPMFEHLREHEVPALTAVAHRVVHGGPRHVKPARIDAALVSELQSLVPLAPLHLPPAIRGIGAAMERYPGVPQIACFDTAFHASLPEVTRRLPIPARFDEEGVRRYGFHGLSFEWALSTLERVPRHVVIAHLGSGASLAAIKDGQSVDTTMSLTPAGGVVMATRSGDLDPGVVIYLLREKGLSVDAVERLLVHESGLAALGGTSDMKELLARRSTNAAAELAVSAFCYSVRKAVGAFAAALGALDLLIFTGGIGENSDVVRAGICAGLELVGIELDASSNRRGSGVISAARSRCEVRVIAANEDLMMARHARALLTRARRGSL